MFITIDYNGHKTVEIYTAQYEFGTVYVDFWHESEPYSALSVCFPKLSLADDEFAFKTYSENQSLYQQLPEQGVIQFLRFEVCSIGNLQHRKFADFLQFALAFFNCDERPLRNNLSSTRTGVHQQDGGR